MLAVVVASPPPASASQGGSGSGDDGGVGEDRGERLRVAGRCGAGATSRLELEAKDDGELEVKFRVRHARPGARWRVALVQERRVVWTATLRTKGSPPSFEFRRELKDLAGADEVTARAWGPRGLACRASAVLPE